jgi:hypothetical protein
MVTQVAARYPCRLEMQQVNYKRNRECREGIRPVDNHLAYWETLSSNLLTGVYTCDRLATNRG